LQTARSTIHRDFNQGPRAVLLVGQRAMQPALHCLPTLLCDAAAGLGLEGQGRLKQQMLEAARDKIN